MVLGGNLQDRKRKLEERMAKLSEACWDSKHPPNAFKFRCSPGGTKAKQGFLDVESDLTKYSVLANELQENQIIVSILFLSVNSEISFSLK